MGHFVTFLLLEQISAILLLLLAMQVIQCTVQCYYAELGYVANCNATMHSFAMLYLSLDFIFSWNRSLQSFSSSLQCKWYIISSLLLLLLLLLCFWTAHCDLLVLAAWQRLNLIRRAKHCGPAFKIHLEQTGGGQSVSFISRICAVGALCYFRRQKRCGKWQKLGDCEVVALTSWTSTS